MQYVGYTYTGRLFVVYLKLNWTEHPVLWQSSPQTLVPWGPPHVFPPSELVPGCPYWLMPTFSWSHSVWICFFCLKVQLVSSIQCHRLSSQSSWMEDSPPPQGLLQILKLLLVDSAFFQLICQDCEFSRTQVWFFSSSHVCCMGRGLSREGRVYRHVVSLLDLLCWWEPPSSPLGRTHDRFAMRRWWVWQPGKVFCLMERVRWLKTLPTLKQLCSWLLNLG